MSMKSILWIILYVLIALALVAGVIIDAQFGPFWWMPSALLWDFILSTTLLSYLIVRQLKWKHLMKAYPILCLLIIAHFIIYIEISMYSSGHIPQINFLILSLMEYYIFSYILVRYMLWKKIYNHGYRP